MTEERRTPDGPDDPEVISDEEWSDESPGAPSEVGPSADDPQGMRGQLDDSMNGLEPDDDEGEAARGIPQNADAEPDDGEGPS
jgi:hypothetical protein